MSDGVGAVRSCDGSLEFRELALPTSLVPSLTSRGLAQKSSVIPWFVISLSKLMSNRATKKEKKKKKRKRKKKEVL